MRAVRFGLAAILAVSGLSGFRAQPAFAAPPTILIDGQKLQSDAPAIEVDGHVLVPLRAIAERLGAYVTYDDKTQVVFAQLDRHSVNLTIGKTRAFVDGKPVTLDVSARTFAGRTEVPLRFVGTSLGAIVDYDPATDTVAVVTGNAPGNFVAAITGPRRASSYAYAPAAAPATISDERPAPESVVGSSYPEIYARLGGGSSAVDPASIRMALDGNDVTGYATISAAYVSYTPSHRLSNGLHTVDVSGRTDDGTPFDEQWTFSVDAGMSSDYVSSIIDQYPGSFGYPGFGFSPPGFSVFVPGPRFFVAGNFIEIIVFSQFFPISQCFVNITGFPQAFPCTPFAGFPGFFTAFVPVPFGLQVNSATVAAHFYTVGGPRVVVHSTAPITVNGKRSTLPEQMRFVNIATVLRHPLSPFHLVTVRHETPTVTTINHTVTTGPGYIHIISLPPNGSSNLPTVNGHSMPPPPTTVHINPPHPAHPLPPPHGSQGAGGQGSGGQGSGGQRTGGQGSGGQGSGGQGGSGQGSGGNPKPTPAP